MGAGLLHTARLLAVMDGSRVPRGTHATGAEPASLGQEKAKIKKSSSAATKGETKSEVKVFVNGLSEAKRARQESVWSEPCPAEASSASSLSKTCPYVAVQLCLGFALVQDQVLHVQ